MLQHPCTLLESRIEVTASIDLNPIIDKDPYRLLMAIKKFDHA